MFLYIGNGLHQNIDFQYRLTKYKSYKTQVIPIGGQIQISGSLAVEEIDRIILDHATYGMVSVTEYKNYRGFKVPYIYSIDKPIPANTLTELIEQNREVNMELGRKQRQEAAVAVTDMIERNTPKIPGIPERKLNSFEMTIEEVATSDRDTVIDEGIKVTRDKNRGAPQSATATTNARSLF
jgi:hypothetical protein